MKRERGAALLLAMVILTLVATVASAMVWQQQRAVQVEASERARAQAGWILTGALDWARLILREDSRTRRFDHLGEPWATPLAEARLSSFLAADKDNTFDSGIDAFLSGAIVDAQSRYNLRNLIDNEGKTIPAELKSLQRLCEAAQVPTDTANRIAEGLRSAFAEGGPEGPIAPRRVADLTWLGLEPALVERLAPFVELLYTRTPINVNTAPREVLVGVIEGLDLGGAERLVQTRQRAPFEKLDDVRAQLGENFKLEESRVGVASNFFEVFGRLRYEDRVLEERSLVERRGAGGGDVIMLRRERTTAHAATPLGRPQ